MIRPSHSKALIFVLLSRRLLGVPTFYTDSHCRTQEFPETWRRPFELFTRSPALFATPVALGFGVIHFISWSSVFSTEAEQRLWHISTIVLISVPLFPVLHIIWLRFLYTRLAQHRYVPPMFAWSARLVVLFYIVARLYLIVEAFASLRSLPPSAFQTVQWTSFIPHV
jgi:hypothetical protein